jgi:hypothetical protein
MNREELIAQDNRDYLKQCQVVLNTECLPEWLKEKVYFRDSGQSEIQKLPDGRVDVVQSENAQQGKIGFLYDTGAEDGWLYVYLASADDKRLLGVQISLHELAADLINWLAKRFLGPVPGVATSGKEKERKTA